MLGRLIVVAAAFLVGCGSSPNGATDASTSPGDDAAMVDASTATVDAATVDALSNMPDAAIPDAGPSAADANTPPAGALLSPPYLMWVTESEVSVHWETDTPVVGYVDYGTTPGFGSLVTEAGATTSHELRLTGMQPGTLHHYRIGWDGYGLAAKTFSTAPDNNTTPFSFVVWGDNQNGPGNFETIAGLMSAETPSFAVSSGDCVQNGTRGEYRSQLFEPISTLADHVPFLVGAGNHERYSDSGAVLFGEYMSQPGDEHCFGWRYGGVYFMFIDTELAIDPGTTQGDCITASLSSTEATTADFRAAVFHKPPRIEWWFGGALAFPNEMEAPWVRNVLEPMLENLDVDIVFNGHNHLYAYSPETAGGITWVTTGGAGGGIDTDFALWDVGDWPEITVTKHEHHFLSVDVNGSQMTVKAINISGTEIHQFTITADP